MTSITHSSPALVSRRTASGERFRFGTDSKALRVGLGVAVAAVLAGDVYAVLRSPVSERSSSSPAASRTADPVPAADAIRRPGLGGAGGFDALELLGEAAYGDVLAAHATPILTAAAAASPVSTTATPTIVAPTFTQPVSQPAKVGPGVGAPSFLPATGPAAPRTSDGAATNPPANARPSLVEQAVHVVEAVPVVGPALAPVVEQAVDAAPAPVATAMAPAASDVAPIVDEVAAAPAVAARPLGTGPSL